MWQSVREVDAANYNKGPYQHALETKSAHWQQCGQTNRCPSGALENIGSYARHWGRAGEVGAHAFHPEKERIHHITYESHWKGSGVTSSKSKSKPCCTRYPNWRHVNPFMLAYVKKSILHDIACLVWRVRGVGTRKHQSIRIDGFWSLIRVFPGDLSIVQGSCEV